MLSTSTTPNPFPAENSGHSRNTQTCPHGESYAGALKDGRRHGKGTYSFNDGSWVQGTWENDNLSGNATFYHAQHQRTDQGTFADIQKGPRNDDMERRQYLRRYVG